MALRSNRMDESRQLLHDAFMFALGAYTEQEAKKEDQWRDQDLFMLGNHLRHEVLEEVLPNIHHSQRQFLIHNAVDAALLSLMLLARALEGEDEE